MSAPAETAVVDRTGQFKTETRYFQCSVCQHQEWAAPGDYMFSKPNPPPILGNTWHFKDKVELRFCLCQKRQEPDYKDKKIWEYAAPTMKLYKATVWLKEGESLPNVGIKVTLHDNLQGKDPSEEKALDAAGEPVSMVPQIIRPQGMTPKAAVEGPGEEAVVDDPDKLFGKEKA